MKLKTDRFSIWNMILSILTIAVFLCIIILYYGMPYRETRENIVSEGKINALRSAEQIDKHLSTSIDVVRLASYTLDNMIRDGRSKEEILDYLISQTTAVDGALLADTTGLYGYIKGEYLDGSGWVPEDDYVPTKRPWYIQAKANSGRLTVVDPYLDSETGTMMITLAKTLCDAESVVAIDIS